MLTLRSAPIVVLLVALSLACVDARVAIERLDYDCRRGGCSVALAVRPIAPGVDSVEIELVAVGVRSRHRGQSVLGTRRLMLALRAGRATEVTVDVETGLETPEKVIARIL